MKQPLILGAGPAGCAAAIALARQGMAPLLVERDEVVGDPLCGGFLSWRTAAQLQELGITCADLGAHRVHRLALLRGGHSAEIALPAPAYGLSRHALDSAMRLTALRAGASIAFDTIREVDGTTAIGKAQVWRGDALFLASGKHDVRGLARPRSAADPALGLRLRLPPSPALTRLLDGRIELHLFERGYAGIVLQEGGSANVCLAIRKSRLTEAGGDPRALLERFAADNPAFADRLQHGGHRAAIETIGAVPYGWIARETTPGLFRLGDQAAVIPSLAGEGIAIALASGAFAAHHYDAGSTAPAYQAAFARRAAHPVRMARIVRALAESGAGGRLALLAVRHLPPLVRIIMDGTRIPGPRSLAQPRVAA